MVVAKFITEAFESPGGYGILTYTPGTIVEEKHYDLAEKGQCGKGIHVISLTSDADFTRVITSDRLILLEVDEPDIIYREGNGKMRVKKVRVLPLEEVTRDQFLVGAGWAYYYAAFIDKCSRDDTRNVVLSDADYAYRYARYVDQCARDDTRNAVLSDPGSAYYYARNVDQCSRDDTRNVVLSDPKYAYYYALEVDRCARDDTGNAVLSDPKWAYRYACDVENKGANQ